MLISDVFFRSTDFGGLSRASAELATKQNGHLTPVSRVGAEKH